MYKNETIMTPLFRGVISILERNGIENEEKVIPEIRDLCKNWLLRGLDDEDDKFRKISSRMDKSFEKWLTQISIELLEIYVEKGEDEASKYWEQKLSDLSDRSGRCEACYVCRKCIPYYWNELGELLFEKVNDEKRRGIYLPLRGLPEDIARSLEASKKPYELYKYKSGQSEDDILVMLKGMSSSTPAILNGAFDTDDFAGGGWYFRHKGFGIAIDPGYHFMQNLHHVGLSVLDVDAVVITHEHIDHNSDMRFLDDLVTSVDKDHKMTWYMDRVSHEIAKIYEENGTGFSSQNNELIVVEPGFADDIIISDSISFKVFPTEHISEDKGYRKHTFGCAFKLSGFTDEADERRIVYTSDTRYYQKLNDYVKDADIIISNISGVYEDDYMMVKEKKNHLGYFGCRKLLEASLSERLRYFVLSEFWNGTGDIRFVIPRNLQGAANEKEIGTVRIIPGEIGMTIDLNGYGIKCDKCGKYSRDFSIIRPKGLYEKASVVCKDCIY